MYLKKEEAKEGKVGLCGILPVFITKMGLLKSMEEERGKRKWRCNECGATAAII